MEGLQACALRSVEDFESGGKVSFINSPRSLEACVRAGYDPSELLPPKNACKPKGILGAFQYDPELEDLRKAHHEQRRQEKVEVVKRERQIIMKRRGDVPMTSTGDLPTMDTIESQGQALKAGILELEEKRHQAIRRRQDREMERIREKERELAELALKLARSEEEEARRKAAHEATVAEKRAEAAKLGRQREVERRAKEDAEDAARHEMTRRAKEQEEKLAAAMAAKTAEREREATQREADRQQKIVEQQELTAALIQAQEERAKEARLEMEARETRVAAQLQEKKERKAAEVESRRAAAERRIQVALERNQKIQDDKKKKYREKQRIVAERAAEAAVREAEEAKIKMDDKDRVEEGRQRRLDDSYAQREARRTHIIQRTTEREKFYETVAAKRAREMAARRLMTELSGEDKREAVERLRRIDDFVRLQTLRRIEEETLRSERIKEQREYMVQQRKMAANLAMMRKHRIKDAILGGKGAKGDSVTLNETRAESRGHKIEAEG